MDPISMMVASVGMQFFNNFANSKKNKALQERQREAQKAAAEHDFDRARRLQAEAAKLALELEKETHDFRVKDIEDSYDSLLDNFAHSFTINNWPLNVLPFIMKGESFGSLIPGSTKSISMHCILTPSNCSWFNEYFYDDLDLRLEAEMNQNWNAQSSHPIVYYGGSWNRRKKNGNFTVVENIDLDDIELLRRKLKSIPTMVVTPYFDPMLHFRVQLWGMGKDNDVPFRIDISKENDNFENRIFSYNYCIDEVPEETDDFFNTTMEEFVPYLECLIGFVADKYFWSMYSIAPQLPILISFISKSSQLLEAYSDNYKSLLSTNSNGIDNRKILALFSGIKPLINKVDQEEFLSNQLDRLSEKYGISNFSKSNLMLKCLSTEDVTYLKELSEFLPSGANKAFIEEYLVSLSNRVACNLIHAEDITFLSVLDLAKELYLQFDNDIKIEIRETYIAISSIEKDGITVVNDEKRPHCTLIKYKNLYLADRLHLNSSSILVKRQDFEKIYNQVKSLY